YNQVGIFFKKGSNITIKNNSFYGWGTTATPSGIRTDYYRNSPNYIYKIFNCLISNNHFRENRSFTSVFLSYCKNIEFSQNDEISKYGIKVYYSTNISVHKNFKGNYKVYKSENISMYDNILIRSSDGLAGSGEHISIHDNNVYRISAFGDDIEIHDNIFLRQGIEAGGQNISIQNNTLHFSAGYTGNVQGAIQVAGRTTTAEPIFSNSNITIKDNIINAKGDLVFTETVVDGFGCAGVFLQDINGLTMVDNIIRSNGRTAKGCLFTHVANTNIQNNSINVKGNYSVGVNIGIHVRWGNRINYGLTMYDNEIVMEGNGTTAFRFQQRVYANDLYDNKVVLNGGYGQKVVAAKDDVTQSISFSEVIMNNTQGLEAELTEDSELTVIGAPITNASVSEDSKLDLYQSLEVGAVDVYGKPLEYVDIKVLNDGDEFSTPGYGGEEPYPGERGYIGPFVVHDRIFDGCNSAEIFKTNMSAKYEDDISWEQSVLMNIHDTTRYIFQVPDLEQPSIPKGLKATSVEGTQSILIEWEILPRYCLEYHLEYRIEGDWQELASVDHPENKFVHTGLDQDTTVYYRIRAFNGNLFSDWSNMVSAVSGDTTPPSPAIGLNITLIEYNRIGISWNQSTDHDVVKVSIQAREKGTGSIKNETEIDSHQTSVIIGGLEPDHIYEMVVRFIDDANLSSISSVMDARTDFMKGTLMVNVEYEEGSIWEGAASSLRVILTGENYSQPSGKTDQFGTCTFEKLHIPDTITVTVEPPTGFEGTWGKIEGYIKIISEDIHFTENGQTEKMDLVMRYYSGNSGIRSGMISGIVSYPYEGKMKGQNVPFSRVEILHLNGTVYNETMTNGEGYFEFRNLPLSFNCRVIAYPREADGDRYLENSTGILSLSQDNFQLTVGIVLKYNPPEENPEYVKVLAYGPTGKITDNNAEIYIEFSHPIATLNLSGMITIHPSPELLQIGISSDRKRIEIDHSGFEYDTRYNVSVSIMLDFEGVLGLNETFKWSFWTDDNMVDPINGEDGDNDYYWLIPAIILVFIIISVGFYLFKKNTGKNKEDFQE
ncbi:MAG TPA: hypothetical protein ENK47_01290, partial [Euryarchaeota archaeon]|nr:hypothetical protein [Euryarchaeota archaeon]